MKVLIDTHIFLWLYLEPKRIPQRARKFVHDLINNEIYVSHVSAWEIAIKYGVGKLILPDTPEIFVPDRISRAGFFHLPIKMPHVLKVHNLPTIHGDPFDRLLISQSNVENLPIVTEDPRFSAYQVKILRLKDL